MDYPSFARINERLNAARDSFDRDYNERIAVLNQKEDRLKQRLYELNRKKHETSQATGTLDAADDDLLEVNAGGKIIVVKRSTLTQMRDTRLETLFSGRWDKKLLRDSHGHIVLDVNPTCFGAIIDYLTEMMISSKDSPPSPPSVDDEHKYILQQQLKLFRLAPSEEFLDSSIICASQMTILCDWLKEDSQDGEYGLLYRGSSDGLSGQAFHSKCDDRGCTLTIIETTCGKVIGGYSNTPWSSSGNYYMANKAFLFAFSGGGILSPCKMKPKNAKNYYGICGHSSFGPVFGIECSFGLTGGGDMVVKKSNVAFNNPGTTYHPGSLPTGEYPIKDMEVFQVTGWLPPTRMTNCTRNQVNHTRQAAKQVNRFSNEINETINAKEAFLLQAESEMLQLEECFNDEQIFIDKFASGDANDVVALNVCGTIMVTKRSSLRTAEDSVLAQQFDDSKWTEQVPCVKEWAKDKVSTWAKSIEGLPEDFSIMLYENGITGRELLALDFDGLKMMGIKRAGTLCLIVDEIKMLKQASQDIVTLIKHSPYCFGKILDYLHLKQLHLLGILAKEPTLPKVQDLQKKRFEKVVKYYFPGDSAKFILG